MGAPRARARARAVPAFSRKVQPRWAPAPRWVPAFSRKVLSGGARDGCQHFLGRWPALGADDHRVNFGVKLVADGRAIGEAES